MSEKSTGCSAGDRAAAIPEARSRYRRCWRRRNGCQTAKTLPGLPSIHNTTAMPTRNLGKTGYRWHLSLAPAALSAANNFDAACPSLSGRSSGRKLH